MSGWGEVGHMITQMHELGPGEGFIIFRNGTDGHEDCRVLAGPRCEISTVT